jgi:hypothetical protein
VKLFEIYSQSQIQEKQANFTRISCFCYSIHPQLHARTQLNAKSTRTQCTQISRQKSYLQTDPYRKKAAKKMPALFAARPTNPQMTAINKKKKARSLLRLMQVDSTD